MTINNDIEVISDDITIIIKNVVNPPSTSPAWIKISHTDSNDGYIAYNEAFGSIDTLGLAENIIVHDVSSSNQNMSQSDVDFSF